MWLIKKLKIVIENNGQYASNEAEKSKGFGVKNTVQRLNLLYGNEAKFQIGKYARKGLLVPLLVIPNEVENEKRC